MVQIVIERGSEQSDAQFRGTLDMSGMRTVCVWGRRGGGGDMSRSCNAYTATLQNIVVQLQWSMPGALPSPALPGMKRYLEEMDKHKLQMST
jgi:hypothetical protein